MDLIFYLYFRSWSKGNSVVNKQWITTISFQLWRGLYSFSWLFCSSICWTNGWKFASKDKVWILNFGFYSFVMWIEWFNIVLFVLVKIWGSMNVVNIKLPWSLHVSLDYYLIQSMYHYLQTSCWFVFHSKLRQGG